MEITTLTYASILNLKAMKITADISTAVDRTASKSASVPDDIRRLDFTSFPFAFTYNPRMILTTIATDMTASDTAECSASTGLMIFLIDSASDVAPA